MKLLFHGWSDSDRGSAHRASILRKVGLRASVCAITLVLVAASTAAAQSDPTLTERLDAMAGSGVLENRAVGIAAAVVKRNDTLLFRRANGNTGPVTELRRDGAGNLAILKKQ